MLYIIDFSKQALVHMAEMLTSISSGPFTWTCIEFTQMPLRFKSVLLVMPGAVHVLRPADFLLLEEPPPIFINCHILP